MSKSLHLFQELGKTHEVVDEVQRSQVKKHDRFTKVSLSASRNR